MCGARITLAQPAAALRAASPLACERYGRELLGQAGLHMQFTSALTRRDILAAMRWWHEPPAPPAAHTSAALSCAELATRARGPLAAVAVSSASANFTLLCVLPGGHGGQPTALVDPPGAPPCPCCWHLAELRAAAAAADPSQGDLKALHKADKWTGCRMWRRYA